MSQKDPFELNNFLSSKSINRRLKNIVIEKSIIVGTIAFYRGKKAEEKHSHKWSCYVRGVNNEDISYFVKKVVFTLHPDFIPNTRTIDKFPFEMHETGWGEFEITAKISFIDPSERAVEIVHMLKLYPDTKNANPSIKKPVVSETYDEIVFCEPTENFYKILTNGPVNQVQQRKKYSEELESSTKLGIANCINNKESEDKKDSSDTEMSPVDKDDDKLRADIDYSKYYGSFSDTQQVKLLEEALNYIRSEVGSSKEKLILLDNECRAYRKKVKELDR